MIVFLGLDLQIQPPFRENFKNRNQILSEAHNPVLLCLLPFAFRLPTASDPGGLGHSYTPRALAGGCPAPWEHPASSHPLPHSCQCRAFLWKARDWVSLGATGVTRRDPDSPEVMSALVPVQRGIFPPSHSQLRM